MDADSSGRSLVGVLRQRHDSSTHFSVYSVGISEGSSDSSESVAVDSDSVTAGRKHLRCRDRTSQCRDNPTT